MSLALAACLALTAQAQSPERPTPPKSGLEFSSADVRSLQADDFANPGMLWVTRGEKLWREPAGRVAKACADCHADAAKSMKGVAARYPRIDAVSGNLVNLGGRINRCRESKQQADAFAPETEELLGITAYVAHQSRGMPVTLALDPGLRALLERGREHYHRRIGQMNLACTHCHDRNWGKQLAAETISQGHSNAYPAYRLGWQSVGSIARRIRACFYGVRAQMPEYGAPELLEIELYLAVRGQGLPLEVPGVRR